MNSLKSLYHAISLVLVMMVVQNMMVYAQEPGEIIADLGFRPELDGFSFENYEGGSNLTAIEMQRLFGDGVCKIGTQDNDAGCDLTSTARMWMDTANEGMSGGHCEGLATLSLLFYTDLEDVDEFGEAATFDLAFDNDLLQREIAFWWATQITDPTKDSVVSDVPSKIVSTLVESMNSDGEIYTLGVYKPDRLGGHSLTPYAVTDQGDGINWIFVYDSNWPDEELFIEVDTKAETWRYDVGSDDPADVYEGTADTKTLNLTPISPRLETQACPFCGDPDTNAGYTSISLDAIGARMSVTDQHGNVTGYVDGEWVNNIPGARMIWQKNIFLGGSLPPQIQFPNGSPYKITATEGPDTPPFEGATFTVVRSGSVTKVTDSDLSSAEETLTVDGDSIQYESGDSGETPVIEQGVTSDGEDYHVVIEPESPLDEGSTLEVSFDPENGNIQVGGSEDNEYNISVDRIDEEGNESNFSIENLDVPADGDANLNAGEWEEGGEITGEIVGEDGTEMPLGETDTEITPDNSNGEGSETGGDGETEVDTGSNDGSDTSGDGEGSETDGDSGSDTGSDAESDG